VCICDYVNTWNGFAMMVNATHVYEYRSLKLYGHEGRQNMQTCNTAVRWDKIPSAFAHDYVNAWNGFAMMVNATHVYEYRYLKLYGHEGRKERRKEGKKERKKEKKRS
jgi:hypothetical protein